MQKFIARESFTFTNGAIGWRPGGPFDCLGPYAKVQQCPIHGTDLKRTCYATGYADTMFSVPACTRVNGKYIGGYFSLEDGAIEFRPLDRFKDRLLTKDFPINLNPTPAEQKDVVDRLLRRKR